MSGDPSDPETAALHQPRQVCRAWVSNGPSAVSASGNTIGPLPRSSAKPVMQQGGAVQEIRRHADVFDSRSLRLYRPHGRDDLRSRPTFGGSNSRVHQCARMLRVEELLKARRSIPVFPTNQHARLSRGRRSQCASTSPGSIGDIKIVTSAQALRHLAASICWFPLRKAREHLGSRPLRRRLQGPVDEMDRWMILRQGHRCATRAERHRPAPIFFLGLSGGRPVLSPHCC